MKKQNVRTLSLIVCTFTYLLVGAAVFDALESEYEKSNRANLQKQENHFKTKYNITEKDYEDIIENVIKLKPYRAGIQWKFAGSFYFATTVITTIGYGHSTPKTDAGKIFCMAYALVGIPLGIVMFQSIGERLNTFVTLLLKVLKKCARMKKTEVSQTNLIIIVSNLSVLVVTAGAAAFSNYEKWPYLDSIYYCFITLTTIGFGDYVAIQKDGHLQSKPEYVAFTLIFILFGLSIISAAMNLLVLRFLTMNTEDERREEIEAANARANAVKLDGDVILSNGSMITARLHETQVDFQEPDLHSVCSCSCYNLGHSSSNSLDNTRKKHRKNNSKSKATRYKVTRSPGRIGHLLQLKTINESYGHSTPKTDSGKVFCMAYALVGIPLCLVMFQSIGERLNTFVTWIIKNLKKCARTRNSDTVSQTNLIVVVSSLSVIVGCAGAAAFRSYEKWPYLDAIYYCFITLTTIGFGDFVALQKKDTLQNKPEYVAFSLVFILFGLTIISAAMNLLVLRFLTMNTEDERRQEIETAVARAQAVRLEGDVITANGNVVSLEQREEALPEFKEPDLQSVCSCTCYNMREKKTKNRRYKVTRSPGKIAHLLPLHRLSGRPSNGHQESPHTKDDIYSNYDDNSVLQNLLKTKRASI
ncbi:unnamed protein product [Owenia fusiformis]|uniref:Uncharacterized protein n=1 Tax=Owenia fusiformis TaxID=6347 RepID=A0A8J1UDM6_OWEFU|nr:unnamed protein product [Owenia fusiformis]